MGYGFKLAHKKNSPNSIYVAVLVLLLVAACGSRDGHPDVSGIKISLQSQRLDRDLAAIDTADLASGLRSLQTKYPDFMGFYLDTLLGYGIGSSYDNNHPGIRQGLRPFLTHPDCRGVFDSVASRYPDTKEIDESLEKGFRYLKHYYPRHPVPRVIYIVSCLNHWAAFTYDTTVLGIGLDMFLGERYPFYAAVGIPSYMTRRFRPEYIPVNAFQTVYRDKYPFVTEQRTLLDMIIQRGKEQYFLGKVIPFTPDSARLGFTASQLEWCKTHEAEIYNFFLKENLLYETNWQKILRYVNDGPTATGMPPESPGNIGTWIGWTIVKAYAAKHPGLSLKELMDQPIDAQRFLQESKYKPR